MSQLARSGPLVELHSITPSVAALETHLSDPLLPKAASRRRLLGYAILHALTALEQSITRIGRERAQCDSGVDGSESGVLSGEMEAEAATLARQVRGLVSKDEEGRSVENYLEDTGLDKLFPKATAFLDTDCSSVASSSFTTSTDTIHHHFQWMGLVNQVVQLSLRLRADLRALPTNRYTAHQLALLYQCLMKGGADFASYRSRIEEVFDDVKRACSSRMEKERGRLSPEVSDVLVELCTEIVRDMLYARKAFKGPKSRNLEGFVRRVGESDG